MQTLHCKSDADWMKFVRFSTCCLPFKNLTNTVGKVPLLDVFVD